MNIIDFTPSKWIWTKDNLTKDQKVVFRKKFSVSLQPEKAEAYIACDTKFWLWLNGKMVVFEGGVFRESRPGCGYAEKVDLAPYLQEGENTLAVLVWFYGNGGRNNTNSGQAGFIFKCDALSLYSDEGFLAVNHPAYVPTDAPHPAHLFGGENIGFDANLDFGDFTASEFDDSAFDPASVFPDQVWGDSIESELPLLKVFPKTELAFRLTENGATAKLPHAMALTVSFELEAQGGEKIDVRTDRYAVPGGPGDEAYFFNCHRIEYTCKPGENIFACLMYLYGEEVLVTFPETVKLQKLSFTESGYNTKQVGSFVTEDPLFNRLMEKSIRTLYVCMRNNFMDCPDRERGQWIGDVSVQVPQVFFVFDDEAKKLLKKAVSDFIHLRKGDVLVGNVPGQHASELPGQSLVAISEYGLIGEYYHYSKDPEIPELVLEPSVNYLKLWELDEEGLLIPRKGNWYWFDHRWNVDAPVLENCMYVGAAKYALQMAEICGDHRFDDFLNERITILSENIEKKFWKGKYYASGSFVDDRANAIAVLSGVCPKERYGLVMKVLMTAFNSTPYFERFVLTALCEMGYIKDAYRRMMARYYPLITNENSTLWEDFYLLGTRNHAWSGGPLEIAYKYFLGLRTEDGFKSYTVSPVSGIFKEMHVTFPAGGEMIEKHIVE
ncbi:MAG: hypothetical protein E7461_01155 [Ruminococcaceae bacterium]|nr:hypothetical protein [Oscillospiraceae bacterium]